MSKSTINSVRVFKVLFIISESPHIILFTPSIFLCVPCGSRNFKFPFKPLIDILVFSIFNKIKAV